MKNRERGERDADDYFNFVTALGSVKMDHLPLELYGDTSVLCRMRFRTARPRQNTGISPESGKQIIWALRKIKVTYIPMIYRYPDRWRVDIQSLEADKKGKRRTTSYWVTEEVYEDCVLGGMFEFNPKADAISEPVEKVKGDG